jgi:hypothetical protein
VSKKDARHSGRGILPRSGRSRNHHIGRGKRIDPTGRTALTPISAERAGSRV